MAPEAAGQSVASSESEGSCSVLPESLPVAVLRFDLAGRCLFLSDNICIAVGLAPEQCIGRTFRELGFSDTQCRFWEDVVRSVFESGTSFETQFTFEGKEGATVLGWWFIPEPDAQGTVQSVLALSRDITDRMGSEKSLHLSTAQLRVNFENTPNVAVQWYDEEGRVRYWNLASETIYGWKAAETLGRTLDALILAPEDAAQFKKIIDSVRATGRPSAPYEMRIRRKNGEQGWVLATTFSMPLGDGNTGFVCMDIDITERKQVEAALRESEARLRTLSDNLPGGLVYQVDSGVDGQERRFTYLSAGVETLHGIPAPEAMADAMTIYGQVLDEDRQMVAAKEEEARANMLPFSAEVRIRLPGGETRWRLFRSAPRRLDDGHLVWDGIEIDITERKQAEKALQESEERYRSIVETTTEWIWEMDGSGRHTFTNPMVTAILGYSPREFMELEFSALLHEEDLAAVKQRLPQLMAGRQGWRGWVLRWRHKDGSFRYLESNARPILDGSGALVGYRGADRDISERIEHEAALRHSQALLQGIFEGTDDCIFVKDENGRYLLYNGALRKFLERLLGDAYPADGIDGKRDHDFLPADIADRLAAHDAVVRGAGKPSSFEETFLLDGQPVFFLTRKFPFTLPAAAGPGILGVARDITGRRRAAEEQEKLQAQLLQVQKMESVGRLAGGVAHDFNNMLSVILGHAEMALEKADPSQPLHSDLEEIRKAAVRSADLTRQLLAFARKQTVVPKVLDLNETVAGMLKMLKRLIGEGIELTWQPGADLWPIRMDPSQIDQILANLCINARDATSGFGMVGIRTENRAFDEAYCAGHPGIVPGEYVELAISDNGCGMDEETIACIFEPFFTTKKLGKGTGLGLSTVYGIVKQNNGFINVYSEPARGTTFQVCLPRQAPMAEGLTEKGAEPPAAQGHQTILLVEDEPAILSMTTMMLEQLGFTVLAAGSPGEALRLAERHPGQIDLLMTDVIMPEMNGRDLAKNLLVLYPCLNRLFMSGYSADVIAPHGVLDEGVHFLQKPFSMQDLTAKVRAALREEQV
ncbi:MAG: PAS domain S-box protein [Desulfobulbaceae bacterium]